MDRKLARETGLDEFAFGAKKGPRRRWSKS